MAAPEPHGSTTELRATLRGLVERDITSGLTHGMQVVVAHHGKIVVDQCIGTVPDGSRAIRQGTRFHVASASKAITAVALHKVVERGLVSYNDPVTRHVEEFGRHGKDTVTIRHTLTHQGGFSDLAGRSAPAALSGDWDAAVAAVCDLESECAPGERVTYHPLSAYAILAEVVRRTDGRDFSTFCQEEIFDPLGMHNTSWGLPPDVEHSDTIGWDDAMEVEVAPWRSEPARRSVIPGGGAYATAGDLAALYLALSAPEPAVLAPRTIEHATRLHAPMAPGLGWGFGYGFMVGTEPGIALSRGNLGSAAVYGHPGFCFAQALYDPRDDVVMAFLANVAPSQSESDRRFGILCDAVYRSVSQAVFEG